MPEQTSRSIELLNRLAERRIRAEAAVEIARHWNAEAVLALIRDEDLRVLRPALGFPQTLPGGPTWREFLARCAEPGECLGKVGFPTPDRVVPARAYVLHDGSALVLVGHNAALSYEQFKRLPFSILFALLRSEAAEQAASGLAAAAREATQRATALAGALDTARGESERNAAELKHALEEAARLNQALQELNDTLEARVTQRTLELERQTEERLDAEAALLQARKMEAVGQLTGGVAHDFNNLLSVIIGNLDLIQTMSAGNPRLERAVDMAQHAADQGARLTEQLLAFARRQILRPETIELNELVREYQALLVRAIGGSVEVRIAYSPEPCYCNVDSAHLQTAILNLAINARDAMPLGGVLDIEIGVREEQNGAFSEARQACLIVKDTGAGIPPDVLERVFEPFFTTKAEGKGTGLGLSQVYGFVRQSGGRVAIESEIGIGTSVKILLPLAEAAARETRDALQTTPTGLTVGSETVLVVEDDPDVAEIALSLLGNLGYRTLVARNGAEALAVLDTSQDVDLLFTDLVMPGGMSGAELARAARGRRPGLKILVTSGYTALEDADDVARQKLPFISKPYRQQHLAATIRAVLDTA